MRRVHDHDISRPANPVAKNFVPPGGQSYIVKDGDSWTSVAQSLGMDPWVLIRFNYPGLPPDPKKASREVNWYLQEYVGCNETTADGHNYVFTSAARRPYIYVPGQCQPPPPNYTRSRIVIPFMYREMVTHAMGPQAAKMADQLSGKTARDALPRTGEPGENAARAGLYASEYYLALDTFRTLVRSGGIWDHKSTNSAAGGLRTILKLSPPSDMHFPIEGDTDHEYYYDIWSNIHYGYVGSAIGIPASLLQKAAAGGGAAGRNDPMDVETIQIGIDLWNRFGAGLTQYQFHQEILARRTKMVQIQATVDYRAANPNFNHIEPITDGK